MVYALKEAIEDCHTLRVGEAYLLSTQAYTLKTGWETATALSRRANIVIGGARKQVKSYAL